MPLPKPPAVRLLEQRKVPFELFEFDDSIRNAEEVAEAIGAAPETVYKTLVMETEPAEPKPCLVMIPSLFEADLKALAAAISVKRLRMASHVRAEQLTGLNVGGISALALTHRGFRMFIDSACLGHEFILVSAGRRGADVRLRVSDLLALTGAMPVAAH